MAWPAIVRSALPHHSMYRHSVRSFTTSARTLQDPPKTEFGSMMDILRRESKTSRKPLPAQRRSPQARTDQPSRGSGSAHDSAMGLARQTQAATRRQETEANVQRTQDRQDLERQMTRRWKVGDVYAPHDLSGVEMSKWKQVQQKGRPKKDVFDMLRINPLAHYKNFAMMSEYMTEMGRIKNAGDTGLRPVNQRRIAKAVRRAIGLGLMPSVHRHPEMLRLEMDARPRT